MKIIYIATDGKDLELITQLRQKQWQYHAERSPNFGKRIAQRSIKDVNTQLLEKASGGLLLDLARDAETGDLVGYCLSSIDVEWHGEIESIYLEPEYRRHRIGYKLVERALNWMDKKGVSRKKLVVGAGNEEVLDFYRRFNFEVRSINMEQLE